MPRRRSREKDRRREDEGGPSAHSQLHVGRVLEVWAVWREGRRVRYEWRPAMERSLVELLGAKRDGAALAPDEIRRLVAAFMDGTLADYQMSAFLMAVYF